LKKEKGSEIHFSNLDIEQVRYTKNADKKYGARKHLTYAWSPTIDKAGGKISY